MKKQLLSYASIGVLAASALTYSAPAFSEEVLVGFLVTLSGRGSIIGKTMKRGFELGMDHVGGKLGGFDTKIFYIEPEYPRRHLVVPQAYSLILWLTLRFVISFFLCFSHGGESKMMGTDCIHEMHYIDAE